MGQKPEPEQLTRAEEIKRKVDGIVSWVDCKLVLQEIIKDLYPTESKNV